MYLYWLYSETNIRYIYVCVYTYILVHVLVTAEYDLHTQFLWYTFLFIHYIMLDRYIYIIYTYICISYIASQQYDSWWVWKWDISRMWQAFYGEKGWSKIDLGTLFSDNFTYFPRSFHWIGLDCERVCHVDHKADLFIACFCHIITLRYLGPGV